MKMRISERRGIALAMSIMAIVIIGALIVGGHFMSRQAYRGGRNSLTQARSFAAAEYGQNEALRAWWSVNSSSIAIGGTSPKISYTATGGGTASIRVTRLQQNLFSIVSDGAAGSANVSQDSRRRTGLMVRLQIPVIDMLGALTARGATKVGGSSYIDGNDYTPPGMTCGAAEAAKPGLVIDDSTKVTYSGCTDQDCLAGNPKMQQNPAAGHDSTYFDYGDIGWDDLVARANKVVTGTINGIGPIVSGTSCTTSSLYNWGDPENGGPCKGYYPIVYSPGNLQITGGYGQGILLVAGDLAVQGGFRFYGPVIVKGKLSTAGTGGHFNGGVLAANVDLEQNTVLGNAVIQYSSCAIANALMGISMPIRVNQRAWADLY